MRNGKPIILGPFEGSSEANRVGFEKLQGDFNPEELPTRNKARATGMIKARILDRTANLEQALQRANHQI